KGGTSILLPRSRPNTGGCKSRRDSGEHLSDDLPCSVDGEDPSARRLHERTEASADGRVRRHSVRSATLGACRTQRTRVATRKTTSSPWGLAATRATLRTSGRNPTTQYLARGKRIRSRRSSVTRSATAR